MNRMRVEAMSTVLGSGYVAIIDVLILSCALCRQIANDTTIVSNSIASGSLFGACRRDLWMNACGRPTDKFLMRGGCRMTHSEAFLFYLNSSNPSEFTIREDIDRDTARTFPALKEFKDLGNRNIFEQVLLAIAKANPDIGYCQGLNFIVATLLLHLDFNPSDAFVTTQCLLDNFHLKYIFAQNVPLVPIRINQFSRLVRDRFPSIIETDLLERDLEINFLVQPWILTLFSTSLDPMGFLPYIWDMFFVFGWKAFFMTGFYIMECLQGDSSESHVEMNIQHYQKNHIEKYFLLENSINKIQNQSDNNLIRENRIEVSRRNHFTERVLEIINKILKNTFITDDLLAEYAISFQTECLLACAKAHVMLLHDTHMTTDKVCLTTGYTAEKEGIVIEPGALVSSSRPLYRSDNIFNLCEIVRWVDLKNQEERYLNIVDAKCFSYETVSNRGNTHFSEKSLPVNIPSDNTGSSLIENIINGKAIRVDSQFVLRALEKMREESDVFAVTRKELRQKVEHNNSKNTNSLISRINDVVMRIDKLNSNNSQMEEDLIHLSGELLAALDAQKNLTNPESKTEMPSIFGNRSLSDIEILMSASEVNINRTSLKMAVVKKRLKTNKILQNSYTEEYRKLMNEQDEIVLEGNVIQESILNIEKHFREQRRLDVWSLLLKIRNEKENII